MGYGVARARLGRKSVLEDVQGPDFRVTVVLPWLSSVEFGAVFKWRGYLRRGFTVETD